MGTHDDRFAAVYEAWFEEVVKWIGALGMPDSETEDLAQEVFLVVNRKLSTFDGRNEAGWLYRITALTVRDHRRRAWFKNLFRRRQHNVDIEAVASADGMPTLAVIQSRGARRGLAARRGVFCRRIRAAALIPTRRPAVSGQPMRGRRALEPRRQAPGRWP